MSLAERLAEARKTTRCRLGQIMTGLAADELEALEGALNSEDVSGASIYQALAAEGYDVGKTTVAAHRSKGCRCP